MELVGDIKLFYSLSELTPDERDRLAEAIAAVAADIRQHAVGATSKLFTLRIPRDIRWEPLGGLTGA